MKTILAALLLICSAATAQQPNQVLYQDTLTLDSTFMIAPAKCVPADVSIRLTRDNVMLQWHPEYQICLDTSMTITVNIYDRKQVGDKVVFIYDGDTLYYWKQQPLKLQQLVLITDETLRQFGFFLYDSTDWVMLIGNRYYSLQTFEDMWTWNHYNEDRDLKYMHQLQEMYDLLIGKK